MPTYFIHTFGCQANKSDSERIAGDYHARGYSEAVDWQSCDDLVINTCAVRKSAEDRARAFLHKVVTYCHEQGRRRPKIIFTGCMLHYGQTKIREMLPMVDEILPVNEVGFNISAIRTDKVHAWVPISQGCNSYCTYCIVPYSRGREKSRSRDEILSEVAKLAKEGYSEITLIGQNVNSWGLEKMGISFRKMLMDNEKFTREDLPSNQSQYLQPQGTPPFVELLRAISAYEEIKTIRFLSSNPWDFHDELIAEIGRNQKIDRYIHLPIQSGSDNVLHRMNRGYTAQSYMEVIAKLRAVDPNIVIGTDIVVGFAGETEAEFQETVAIAQKANWKLGFVAIYSPRAGTAAWKLYPDTISHQEKKRRWDILDQIINKDNLSIRPKVV